VAGGACEAGKNHQLTFEYLTQGDGPLALCVHGFPVSPCSYRYLLPALAEAGYWAVSPFNRGFAPTELPADRHHIHFSMMAADQTALHEALSGDRIWADWSPGYDASEDLPKSQGIHPRSGPLQSSPGLLRTVRHQPVRLGGIGG